MNKVLEDYVRTTGTHVRYFKNCKLQYESDDCSNITITGDYLAVLYYKTDVVTIDHLDGEQVDPVEPWEVRLF